MEVIAATRRRKEQLLKEIEDIKVAIKELESNQLCEFNTESEKEVQDTEALMHALMVTENINRIKYTNTELISLEENTFEYQADANTGPVYYHLKFNITFSPDGTQPSVSDLKITLNNEFIQNELKPWQNKCIRDSSLQTFQRGIVSYGELFIKRKEIFLYLKENAPEYFLLEICVEDGKYIITAIDKKTDTQYFCCSWAITWNCATFSMINFFSLQANNKVPFFNKNKDLFTELTELASNVTSDRVEEIWKTLANNVIEEISSSLDSSEDENTFV